MSASTATDRLTRVISFEATAKTIDRNRVADLTEREQAKLADRTPESRRRYERGVKVMPGGVPSSFQVNDPWPVYLERGDGAGSGTSTAASTWTSTTASA